MKLPTLRKKKYTDPLSVMQSETVGVTSAYHNGAGDMGDLMEGLDKSLDKSRQAIREAIERSALVALVGIKSDNEDVDMGISIGVIEYRDNLLRELGLDKPVDKS